MTATFRTSQIVSDIDVGKPHLILVGLPGAGKSVVGAALFLPKFLTYVSTHPAIEQRIKMLDAMAAQTRYQPVKLLAGTAWTSVGDACR